VDARNRFLQGQKGYSPAADTFTSLREIAPDNQGSFVTGGRILFLGQSELQITSAGTTMRFFFPSQLELAPGFLAREVLREDDIIQITVAPPMISEVILLAPATVSRPPISFAFDFKRATLWQDFMNVVRQFFLSRSFWELRTPTLVRSPGLEPELDVFETEFSFGRSKKTFFLPTSPEFHLKKALALGYERCFEFKECFRNGELSQHHQPEFVLLEWYRCFKNLDSIRIDIHNLVSELQHKFTKNIFETQFMTMEELWKNELNFTLTPQTNVDGLRRLCDEIKLEYPVTEDFDDLFTRVFVERLEPVLAKRVNPTIVWHYPPSQCALARLTEDGWADRFELYWRGLEIANAFHELNDPIEQRRRFLEDQRKKEQKHGKHVPIDDEFLDFLSWGMPPSAGVALGLERLFMALFGIGDLADVRLFPLRLDSK